jgi:hypothetical protein
VVGSEVRIEIMKRGSAETSSADTGFDSDAPREVPQGGAGLPFGAEQREAAGDQRGIEGFGWFQVQEVGREHS